MTFQRKLLLGFSLMALPALLVAGAAIRTNLLERAALRALGEDLARSRTYGELETAMFNQTETVWRYLTGMDPTARQEFDLNGDVIDYWLQRWRSELRPDEMGLANDVHNVQQEIRVASLHVFAVYDSGHREGAYRLAQQDIRDRLLPVLDNLNRDIYRRARESSVRGAYTHLADIVAVENRALVAILVLALATAFVASWLIARSLARPISQLREGMAVVGTGRLDYPIETRSSDEIGDLARAFATMTDNLRQSRADMDRLNTELEAKVAQLERTQAQLLHSERLASIGEMAAAVAHGIRNPLASLRAAAQLALRQAHLAAPRAHLGVIIGEVDRLDRRVSHLLNFSRPAPVHQMRESVARLIEDLTPPFIELLRERQITLEVEVAPSLPDVRVDPMQVEQALVEILSNALDAMPTGGHLRIAARADTGDDGPGVEIEIADTGVGIPAHVMPSIFDPFFTTRPEGTGLGLAVAKRFIEQNGGQLAIVSAPAAGTTIRIRLPAAPDDDAPPASSATASSTSTKST
jgi:signal transduction histidine kinase